MNEFIAGVGTPVKEDNINGLRSLFFENIVKFGYPAFMVAYFSQDGLQGGTYYFITNSFEEIMRCYTDVQNELLLRYGPTLLLDLMLRERRPYETSWDLETGFILLRIDTRRNELISLWYSSPALTRMLRGM